MAKVTWSTYGPDDPIFKSGPQVFVPASRPSTESSQPATAGTPPSPQELTEQEAADLMAQLHASHQSKKGPSTS